MKKFNRISGLLMTLLAVALVACVSSFIMLCVNGADPYLFTSNEREEKISSAQLGPTFDYGGNYIRSIIFVGDRTIASISNARDEVRASQVWSGVSGSLPLDYNLATTAIIHSDDPKGSSIADAAGIYRPQYILITVGLENGVGHCSEEKFKEYYTRLIESIRESAPETKVILQSILPVSKDAERADASISNDRIDAANVYIATLAEELSVRYLNTASALKGEDGRLDPRYDSGDGIVLNAEGYGVMLDYIRMHGYK